MFLSACGAPQYDQVADQKISTLQGDINAQAVKLLRSNKTTSTTDEKKAGDYSSNTKFYDKAKVDVSAIEMRMLAQPDKSTQHISGVIDNLRTNLDAEEKLHEEDNRLADPLIVSYRNGMTIDLQWLLMYELGLKQGAKKVDVEKQDAK